MPVHTMRAHRGLIWTNGWWLTNATVPDCYMRGATARRVKQTLLTRLYQADLTQLDQLEARRKQHLPSAKLKICWTNSRCHFGIQAWNSNCSRKRVPYMVQHGATWYCFLLGGQPLTGRVVRTTQFDAFICAVIMLNTLVTLGLRMGHCMALLIGFHGGLCDSR